MARPRSRATFTPPLRPASATVIPPFFSSAISCLRWLEGSPLPSAVSPLVLDPFLALLDQLPDLLAALAADFLVKGGAVLVAYGLSTLAAAQLSALAADLLVERDAALVAHALAALAAGFPDRHTPLAVHAPFRHGRSPEVSYSSLAAGNTSPPTAGTSSSRAAIALASLAAFFPSSISWRTLCPPFLPISS